MTDSTRELIELLQMVEHSMQPNPLPKVSEILTRLRSTGPDGLRVVNKSVLDELVELSAKEAMLRAAGGERAD